jgi:hypothetical protein
MDNHPAPRMIIRNNRNIGCRSGPVSGRLSIRADLELNIVSTWTVFG